jgi:TRAP-type C4-dicarboxylate transport system permease small subunit
MAGPSDSVSAAPRPSAGAPLLARADWWTAKLEDALNLIGAVAIFGVMVVGVAQILSRSVSGWLHTLLPAIPRFAIHGYIDYIQFIGVLYAILGIAYCQRVGGHIRMEIVLANLRGRLMWIFETLATVVAISVCVLLIIGTWDNFHNAWARGDSSMDIKLPLWPSKLVVPLMLGVLLARLLLQLWGCLRMLAHPARTPLAVPVPETVEQMARREIEEAIGKTGSGAGR